MIELLPHADIIPSEVIVFKINQLIKGYNELHEKLDPLQATSDKAGNVTWQIRSDLLLKEKT
jgi:hypothetical protein